MRSDTLNLLAKSKYTEELPLYGLARVSIHLYKSTRLSFVFSPCGRSSSCVQIIFQLLGSFFNIFICENRILYLEELFNAIVEVKAQLQ